MSKKIKAHDFPDRVFIKIEDYGRNGKHDLHYWGKIEIDEQAEVGKTIKIGIYTLDEVIGVRADAEVVE